LTGSSRSVNIGEVEDLIVSVTGTVSANADCSISRFLRVDAGATIDVTGHEAVLLADATQTALVHDNGGTTVGDFTVQQHIKRTINTTFGTVNQPYANVFYGPPVSNPAISQMQQNTNILITGNANAFYFNEATAQWTPPSSFNDVMPAGQGWYQYAFIGPSGDTWEFEGELNTGTVSTPISNSAGGGWNIVSNPYPSPINLQSLWGFGQNPAVYYRYNGNSYNTFIAPIGLSNPPGLTQYAPLMQGFWVNAGTYTSVTFNNNSRVTNPAQAVDDVTKTIVPVFRLAMAYETDTLTSAVYFFNAATDGVDEDYDGLYLDGDYSFQFATKSGNTNMSINGLSELTGLTDTIPLHTELTVLGNYTISLTELSNFPSGTKIMLQDLLLSVSHDLTKGDYSYIGNPVEGNDRFIITVISSAATGIDKVEDEATFEAYRCFDNLCVSLPKALDNNASINVYNALGQIIFSSTLEEGKQFWSIENANLSGTNVYFVDIEGYEKSAKIVWE
jgi:hypothetical protein